MVKYISSEKVIREIDGELGVDLTEKEWTLAHNGKVTVVVCEPIDADDCEDLLKGIYDRLWYIVAGNNEWRLVKVESGLEYYRICDMDPCEMFGPYETKRGAAMDLRKIIADPGRKKELPAAHFH